MKQKVGFSTSSIGKGLMIGIAVSIAITMAGAAVCAALISSETIAAGTDGYCAMAVLLLASMGGAVVGAGKVKEKRLYVCLLTAMAYILLLLSITALFFDGQYIGIGVTALVIFAGGVAAAFLGKNGGKRSHLRKSKIKRR